MAVTTLDQLRKYSEGSEVELPGFYGQEPITVRLKRPSLMLLVQSGEIPNPLLNTAAELFQKGVNDAVKNGDSFKYTAETLTRIAKASLIEPTYADFEKLGLVLTDAQLMYIYTFAQTGVDSFKSFRKEQEALRAAEHGKPLPKASE